jgi:hypothetical protein
MVRSSVLAVLRLMTGSNCVSCSTGRSPSLAPCEQAQGEQDDAPGGAIPHGRLL